MIARYVDSIGRMMRPGLTLLFTTIAILGMISVCSALRTILYSVW